MDPNVTSTPTGKPTGQARRIGVILVTAVLALTSLGVAATPAAAAKPQMIAGLGIAAPMKIGITLARSAEAGLAVGPQAAPPVINCYIGVGGPVEQGFNVLVGGIAYCSYPINSIDLTVELYYNGSLWGSGSGWSVSATDAVASAPCLDGGYHGKLTAKFTAPYGYTPPTATGTKYTSYVNIDCSYP